MGGALAFRSGLLVVLVQAYSLLFCVNLLLQLEH